jgi:hypothetical protein
LRSAASPIADPPPVGGQTWRDQRADGQLPGAETIGQPLQLVVARVDAARADRRETDSTPSNLTPSDRCRSR